MTALKITIPDALDRFVEEQVRSGAYPDAEAVVRAGLDRLRADAEQDAVRFARFHGAVQEGLEDLKVGRLETVDNIGAWLDELEAEVEAEASHP